MKDLGSSEFGGFNGRQRITATSTLLTAMSAIRLDTLDTDISDRQAHVVMLLGSRSVMVSGGFKLKTMTATRLNEHIRDSFDVSDTAAEGDLKKLKDMGITTCVSDPNDGRVRIIALTESGEALYELLADRMASLILATAKMLERDGPVPSNPLERIADFVTDFARRVRAAFSATILAALTVLATPSASDASGALMVGNPSSAEAVYHGDGSLGIEWSFPHGATYRDVQPPNVSAHSGGPTWMAVTQSAYGSLVGQDSHWAIQPLVAYNHANPEQAYAIEIADVRKFYEDGLTVNVDYDMNQIFWAK
ncbi:hypothetical protein [Rubrimonas cliftonensis]|uniref:DNA-binding transcriptional regulator, MarR family n=1 Tax=Rubrimonas cliftonensis TaxID=89524 RepID=A0A1H4FXM6_9RHOB|nr:hypothetical protein [Rubrimonas cliftonensis]SEB02075.1 hypothetical protein SAMN05444370_1314 [Rubrimonas cliftonensis]